MALRRRVEEMEAQLGRQRESHAEEIRSLMQVSAADSIDSAFDLI